METKINIDKLICSLYDAMFDGSIEKNRLAAALRKQGLEVFAGELVEIAHQPKFKACDDIIWKGETYKILGVSNTGYHCDSCYIPFAQEENMTLYERKRISELSQSEVTKSSDQEQPRESLEVTYGTDIVIPKKVLDGIVLQDEKRGYFMLGKHTIAFSGLTETQMGILIKTYKADGKTKQP